MILGIFDAPDLFEDTFLTSNINTMKIKLNFKMHTFFTIDSLPPNSS